MSSYNPSTKNRRTSLSQIRFMTKTMTKSKEAILIKTMSCSTMTKRKINRNLQRGKARSAIKTSAQSLRRWINKKSLILKLNKVMEASLNHSQTEVGSRKTEFYSLLFGATLAVFCRQ